MGGIADLLGWLWWGALPIRRRLAIDNFQQCFPELDAGSHLRRSVGEVALQYLELVGGRACPIEGIGLAGQGGLMLAAHSGPWELMLASLSREVPVSAFVRPPSSPRIAWALQALRQHRGGDLQLWPAGSSPKLAYEALSQGRIVLLLPDQRHNGGLSVPFFGRPCQSAPGFGAMAWMARPPLLGIRTTRTPQGRPYAYIERLPWEIPQQRGEAIAHLTACSQQWVEAQIRAEPHRWLWLHDRWKPPTGSPPPLSR